jgi:hypothetical protein
LPVPRRDPHTGRSRGGRGASAPATAHWEHRDEDFTRPTRCPRCHAQVFYVRHNGGSAWFDDLGRPWLKHPCFDEPAPVADLRRALRATLSAGRGACFGVVVSVTVEGDPHAPRFDIRWSGGTTTRHWKLITRPAASYLGQLVVGTPEAGGGSGWEFLEPTAMPAETPRTPAWPAIATFAVRRDFPANALGKVVRLHNMSGRVVEVVDEGKKFRFQALGAERVRTFKTAIIVAQARAAPKQPDRGSRTGSPAVAAGSPPGRSR